ncbi:hypothetical protein [Streptomyces sp. 067-1]|uniref:hypothetical protein n=1 Tax=Streptomyces sp. 067-1 TaxID=2789269 RepID=UPI0039F56E18
MLSHALEEDVLVITVHQEPRIDGRAELIEKIGGLIHAYRPAPVVVVLDEAAVGGTVISVIRRTHRLCDSLGVLMSVATHSAPVRRLLEAGMEAGLTHLVIHARADIAVSAAALAAAA